MSTSSDEGASASSESRENPIDPFDPDWSPIRVRRGGGMYIELPVSDQVKETLDRTPGATEHLSRLLQSLDTGKVTLADDQQQAAYAELLEVIRSLVEGGAVA
jgi:hypothetical protein